MTKLPIIGGISNHHERVATWVLGIIVIIAGAINFSVRQFVLRDIAQATALREAGDSDALLTVRGLEVGYGNVQILFGVDFDVSDGEIVGREGIEAARARHRAALAELPPYALQLSRGYPAIPTVFDPDGAET